MFQLNSARWSFLLLWLPALAWGQQSGAVSGRVQDASGAAITGATVTVRHLETGISRTIPSNASGDYRVLAVPVGPLEVRAEKTGFKTAVRLGVNLVVEQEAVVNLNLEVGDLAQTVTVSAEAPLVNTTTSSISGLVDERQVKELPLNGRSFDNLITLNPGAINYGLKSAQTSTSNGNTFSVSGRRPMDNLFLLNGVEYTGSSQLAVTPGGVSGDLLGIDAVREFNVLTETYSAEFGKRAGAQVTVVTQSGANQIHGGLFEFLRNSALDSRNFFDQSSVPPFRRNQFGGSLGGPLKKDRLFLFGNYEGFQQSLAVTNISVVPDAQARLGFLPNASTGILPAVSILNPSMAKYMSFWPDANGPEIMVPSTTSPSTLVNSGTAKAFYNPHQSIHENFGTMRTDYAINNRDSFSGAYTIDDGNSIIPVADPLFASAVALRNQVASLRETHIFSPRALNTATLGFSRAAFNFDSFPLTSFPASASFVTGMGPGGIVIGGAVTTTGASVITSAGPNGAAGVWNRRNLFTYSDSAQVVKGAHQFSAGVWFQRLRDNENSASRRQGQATFASLTTFLQGNPTNFQVVPNPNELGWRNWMGAWYIEDSVKLRPRLTLRIGLRHEFTTGFNEASARAANYVTDGNGILVTAPLVGNSVYTANHAKKLFSPRVALAWDPFGNGNTAVRAGFGTYYSLVDNLAFLINALPPYNGAPTYTGSITSGYLPVTPGAQPPPACTNGTPAVANTCSIFAPQGVQSDARTPTVQEWNLTMEQRLPGNMALRVAYVGSFGYHGLLSIDPNSIPSQICASAACTSGGISTTCGTATTPPCPSVTQGAQYIPKVASRPNRNLSGGFFWYTEGNSSYNALQTDLSKHFSHGLQYRFNYTWSKNLDMNSGLTGAQANNQAQMIMDRNDLRRDWGPSALNVKHQASISGSYELPFGKGRRFLNHAGPAGDRAFGAWQLNAIATMLSGFPVTPQIGANVSGDGDTRNPDRPSVNPAFSGPVVSGLPTQWFSPTAYTVPATGIWGNLGRGVLNGPGLANLDMSVLKNIALREKMNLQFRAEAFNLLNRANFGTPNAITNAALTKTTNGITTTSYAVSPSAGLITSTVTTSRQIQFGLKLVF